MDYQADFRPSCRAIIRQLNSLITSGTVLHNPADSGGTARHCVVVKVTVHIDLWFRQIISLLVKLDKNRHREGSVALKMMDHFK